MTDIKGTMKNYLPILLILCFYIAVQAIALFLSGMMVESGLQVFQDPTKISNSAIYIGLTLISAVLILILIKFGIKWIFKFLVYISTLLTLYITFAVFFTFIPFLTVAEYNITGFVMAILLTVMLYMYPEWYIIDTTGVLSAGGIAALFGISFSIIPAIVVLVLLAIYDAISVYKTKHMITMADAGMDTKLPLMLIAPKRLDYSFIKSGFKKGSNEAFFLGVGDVVEPTILVVSAHVFLHSAYPVIGAVLGTLLGCMVLFTVTMRGSGAQAGLPFLNFGAILGFFTGVLLSGTWIV